MLSALLEVVIPVFAIAGVGFIYASRRSFPVHVITDLIIYVTGPCLVFDALQRAEPLTFDAARAPLSAVLVISAGVGWAFLARRLSPDLRRLPLGAVALPVAFMNAGNLGLPMAQLSLGQPGLEVAMLFFVTFNVLMFSVGVALASGGNPLPVLLRLPLLHATILGLVANQLDLEVPKVVSIPVSTLAQMVIPSMLLALGARLRSLAGQSGQRPPVRLVLMLVALRTGGGIISALIVNALIPNHDIVGDITLLGGFLPPAVMTFALTEKYGKDPYASAVVSAAIAVGTAFALLSLPIWVLMVK